MYPVTVMTRILTFSLGNRYIMPLFATVTGWGIDSTSICHTDGMEFSKPCLVSVAWGGREPEGDV